MSDDRMVLSSTLAQDSSVNARAQYKKGNQHPEILPAEIELGEKLGEGSFSQVFKGKCRGQEVAVKIFNIQNDDGELDNIRKEIQVMSQIFHPNVVLFMGACTDPDEQLMIVTERLPTDLHTLVIENKKKFPLSLRKRMKMAKQAALGVNWLHSGKQQFIHRDLKLSNLLVTHDFHVRVADFGLTTLKDKKGDSEQPQGSPAYMAPEVFMGSYDEKCDVYSFGMVLWEMLTQERVFSDLPNLQQLMYAVIEERRRPEIPQNCPTSLRNLINACWAHESTKRPSFQEIVDALDHVLVDVVVQDHDARSTWKKHFWGKTAVPWESFCTVVCKTLKADEPDFSNLSVDLACLREMTAAYPKKKRLKGSEMMTAEKALQVKLSTFGNMVQCFGPFDKGFVRRIRKVLASKWFWGSLSQRDAEAALSKHKTTGTFLIRFSSSPGFFTLSFIGKSQIEHHRIIHMPGKGCLVWGKKPKDLAGVIELGKEKKMLRKHCGGSPYTHLFAKKKKHQAPQPQSGYHLPSEADLQAMYGSGPNH